MIIKSVNSQAKLLPSAYGVCVGGFGGGGGGMEVLITTFTVLATLHIQEVGI